MARGRPPSALKSRSPGRTKVFVKINSSKHHGVALPSQPQGGGGGKTASRAIRAFWGNPRSGAFLGALTEIRGKWR